MQKNDDRTPPEATSGRTNYFASIDGIRLIASVNVVLFHLVRTGALDDLHGAPGWLFALIKGPAFHASLFFILGGFIYGAKYAGRESSFNPGAFFAKRLKALYPLHAITLAIMVIICFVNAPSIDYARLARSIALHASGAWALWPQSTYTLNTPSWALSAFFLCYALFGPCLRLTALMTSRFRLVLAMALMLGVIASWSGLYAAIGDESLYQQFHVFAPVRVCEFIIGILLARFYLIHPARSAVPPLVNDAIVLGLCAAIYCNVRWMHAASPGWVFFRYHTVMLPLYALLVYRMVRADGVIAAFFGFAPVRIVGMCSFYPYLIHIPLASLVELAAKRIFHVDGLFHKPLPLVIFMVVLYIGSALLWQKFRTGRSKKS